MTDDLAHTIADAYTRRADSVEAMRRENNPFIPEYKRPERRTGRTYADPTGGRAVGRARKEDPDGSVAQARALRRAAMERKTR